MKVDEGKDEVEKVVSSIKGGEEREDKTRKMTRRRKRKGSGVGAQKGDGEGGIYTPGQDHGEKSGESQRGVALATDLGTRLLRFLPQK